MPHLWRKTEKYEMTAKIVLQLDNDIGIVLSGQLVSVEYFYALITNLLWVPRTSVSWTHQLSPFTYIPLTRLTYCKTWYGGESPC